MRILCFGDSITQGFCDSNGGWVNRLRYHYDKKLIEDKDEHSPTVFNLGISGETTEKLLERIENEIIARKFPGEEFKIIIATGTNDSIYYDKENKSEPEDYTRQLFEITEIAKNFTQDIHFIGLTPVIDELLQPIPWSSTKECFSSDRMKLFNEALKNFCNQNKKDYIDIWNIFLEEDLNSILFDGLHPNNKGHNLMFKQILKSIS